MVKRSIHLLIVTMLLLPVCPLYADDLEIFGGQMVGGVPPNVLIIFDNSGSMTSNDVPDGRTRLRAARDVLLNLVNTTDTEKVHLGLMSYIKDSGGVGGRIHLPCGASKAALVNGINYIHNSYEGGTGTPLGEVLEEAGLYFAGEPSVFAARENEYSATETATAEDGSTITWYQNASYVSPVEYTCQKNIIIFMTDGDSRDDGERVAMYVSGVPIGDDGDGELIDDVAKYFTDHQVPITGLSETQNVQVYTIGFDTLSTAALLQETATNGNGDYYPASDPSGLSAAFEDILIKTQLDADATYAAPVIPRNPDNQIQAGNKVYMPFFKPQADGRWVGNLKAYGLVSGVLQDTNGVPATYPTDSAATGYVAGKEGYIKPTAQSYWSSAADGLDVAKGGAGELLNSNISRNVYTYTYIDEAANYIDTSSNQLQRKLSHQNNEFKTTTNNRLEALLTVIYPTTPPDDLIDLTLNGTSVTYEDGTTASWTLGDIVHSEPLVQSYAQDCNGDGNTPDDYIFVGANDGMLHVFCAEDGGEEWAFVPPKQLSRLHLLESGSHDYFVDGSPVIENLDNGGTPIKMLFFGEGRGGERYYALDVTDPADPYWKYQVIEQKLQNADGDGDGSLDGAKAVLGQSWAKPQRKRVRYLDLGIETFADVFLLAGGYDPRYEDNSFPASIPQATEIKGRSIYTINALSGSLVGLNINGGYWSEMQHSILDVTAFDAEDRGYINRAYAGDLGGKVFGAKYDAADDKWEKQVLLDLPVTVDYLDSSSTTITAPLGQKFMTKPDATIEYDGECLYFGTGDREHLTSTDNVDAFYTICNKWDKSQDVDGNDILDANGDFVYESVAFTDLVDVTDNLVQDGTAAQKVTVNSALSNGSGWFIRMEHDGEKITSTPIVIDGKVFFNTFTPGLDNSVSNDPCTTEFDLGVSRLYAVDYRTGGAVMNLDDSDDELTKTDRSVIIGTSVAPDLVLTTIGDTTTLVAGSGGKLLMIDVDNNAVLRRYYWRQIK